MKLLSFHYHLKITMDAPVSRHCFTLRCTPVSDARQRILQAEHAISPADFLSQSQDHWGNALLYGSCRDGHTEFEANVYGHAVTGLADCVPAGNGQRDLLFQYPTELTAADAAILDFSSRMPQADALAQAQWAMDAVHQALRYQPGSTTVHTTAREAFAAGEGVCQDYAHVMLAILRSRSIPCRYVVGMLMGEGKSHAWVEVLHRGSWYAFDPTNCQIVTDQHIKLSHGRDYQDCTINQGVFRGAANQATNISVIVTEIR